MRKYFTSGMERGGWSDKERGDFLWLLRLQVGWCRHHRAGRDQTADWQNTGLSLYITCWRLVNVVLSVSETLILWL